MSTKQGIQNFSEMEDTDKAYLVKILSILGSAFIAGIITGIAYQENGGIGIIGFGIFLATLIGSSFYVKYQYDLSEMSDIRIIRHGVIVSLLTFIFFWVTIFQFVYTGYPTG